MKSNVISLIGNTPLVKINKAVPESCAKVYAKLEGNNPGGSVKDRIAKQMIEVAEEQGLLKAGATIIEPTSGNTGIGLAMICAFKGYHLILTMPESMSLERRQVLQAYGAEIVLTPADKGMRGAVEKAEEIKNANPDFYMPQQFSNPANPIAHRVYTANEIIKDLGFVPDAFVVGVGTGGTITGVGEVFKAKKSDTLIVAVEPEASPVLSGGNPGKHKIAGIGAGFVPSILNRDIIDEIIKVSDDDAIVTARDLALKEGLFVGISSGAAFFASLTIAQRLGINKSVVTVFPDRGDKYLSTGLFNK
ncbi:MAG: cysteine synthase A [Thermodesulfovibrionales bacterium]|nr:cysteine synthase A [Thermodesulfovibrionales bacterium]